MNIIKHPSVIIAAELVHALRSVAAEAELQKQLHPLQLSIIQKQKWFQLFVPEQYNGLELSLPEALQLEEALAWTDGSVGWTVTLCAGAGWFIGFLHPEIVDAVFSDENVCVAGSGKSSGIAKKIGNEYNVTGYWNYATGANAATAFTANCMIEENGKLLTHADGSNVIQSFLFLKDEVTVHENWKPIGMIATGSNRFEVNGITVSNNRSFVIDQRSAVLPNPIYQYPFLQFAETTLAVNICGMSIRFLDLCTELFQLRSTVEMQTMLDNAIEKLEDTRTLFYKTAAESWEECRSQSGIPAELLHTVSDISKQLARTSRQQVDELYPYCGMEAANPETEINRVWRNLHTASQHRLLNS